MALSDQVVQKGLDIVLIQFLGMSLVVEEDELPAPVDVAGGCARAVVASEAGETDLFEEFWLLAVRDVRNTPLSYLHGKARSYGVKLWLANRGPDLLILITRQRVRYIHEKQSLSAVH